MYVPLLIHISFSGLNQPSSTNEASKLMYRLPKLHKRPYKARFIANSSSCTTNELSKLLTSCLTAIKSHVIRYCETVYETSNKNWFWSIKNSGEVLSKLKCDKLVHI